ncbi:MAG: hypothetical protein IPO81_09460 [Kouleothrix sp.]|nr:hypothetical protein [Kouleothrix sp.]
MKKPQRPSAEAQTIAALLVALLFFAVWVPIVSWLVPSAPAGATVEQLVVRAAVFAEGGAVILGATFTSYKVITIRALQ